METSKGSEKPSLTTDTKYRVEVTDTFKTFLFIRADSEEEAIQKATDMQIQWAGKRPRRTIGAVDVRMSDPEVTFKHGQKVRALIGRIWQDAVYDRFIWDAASGRATHAVTAFGCRYFINRHDVKAEENAGLTKDDSHN